MIFRRGLIRLAKAASYTGLFWILLAIFWLALPFPAHNIDFPTSTLNAGKTLTRVFQLQDFFPYTDKTPSVTEARRTGRSYMSLDFQLQEDALTGVKSLAFWGGGDVVMGLINRDYKPLPRNNISLSLSGEAIHVSEPMRTSSNTGDLDGINLPYFATADAALLFWWINHDTATITVRTRFLPAENKVELWPDSWAWGVGPRPPPSIEPLLTIELAADVSPVFTFPQLPKSSSPSVFYNVRVGILVLLVPIGIFFMGLFYGITGLVSLLFRIVVGLVSFLATLVGIALGCIAIYGFVWWLRNGRPPIPIAEIGRAVAAVVHGNRQAVAVEETGLIDLEAQRPEERPEPETAVLVDVSGPKADATTASNSVTGSSA